MRIAVIGAGLVGVTTAWELAADGHEIVVYDRHDSVAAEGSFAPGGVLAPAAFFDAAWPGLPGVLVDRVHDAGSPFHAGPRQDGAAQAWMRRWTAAGDAGERAAALALIPLLRYGHGRWLGLLRAERIEIERSTGALALLTAEADLVAARPWLRFMAEQKLKFSLLDETHCRSIEPGLAEEASMRAGVLLPDAESANVRQFAQQLKTQLLRQGVGFRFNTRVSAIEPGISPRLRHEPDTAPARDGGFDGFRSSVPPHEGPGEDRFDRIVVCAGLGADDLLRAASVALPLGAIWGASVTVPIRLIEAHPDIGPRHIVLDVRTGASVSRFGRRLRASAGGLLTGPGRKPDTQEASRLETQVYAALDRWFPGCYETSKAQRWIGARPSLPDGLPALGPSALPGVWLNVGHGSLGWAMALGCARLLADAMADRPTSLPLDAFAPGRFA